MKPLDNRFQLPDGRHLGWAEYGSSNGQPVFLFHGAPGSRLECHPNEVFIESLGIRVIAAERPGYGLSDFQPARKLLDWPDDVRLLADSLGIERFPVLGVSAGGTYAAACAWKLRNRVTRAAVVSSMAPLGQREHTKGMSAAARLGLLLGRHVPRLLLPLMWLLSNPGRNPEKSWYQLYPKLSPSDQALLSRPDIMNMLIEDTRESARQGIRGYWWDIVILARPWGFDPREIPVHVHLWHGQADNIVPWHMGRRLAEAIPNCEAHFLPGEGHFLLLDHLEEIVDALSL